MAERYASLPMYDLAEPRAATDDWWAGLARHFRIAGITETPDALTRPGGGFDHWAGGDLLLSQTCGYPLVTTLAGRVRLVATPCYDAPGCDGPRYCSLIVVHGESPARRLEDLRGGRCAVSSVGPGRGITRYGCWWRRYAMTRRSSGPRWRVAGVARRSGGRPGRPGAGGYARHVADRRHGSPDRGGLFGVSRSDREYGSGRDTGACLKRGGRFTFDTAARKGR